MNWLIIEHNGVEMYKSISKVSVDMELVREEDGHRFYKKMPSNEHHVYVEEEIHSGE